MKNCISLLLFISLALNSHAQTEKGSKLVGISLGSFGFANNESSKTYSNSPTTYNYNDKNFTVVLQPNLAWMVTDHLAVGGMLQGRFQTSKSKSSNSSSTQTTTYRNSEPSFYFGPLLRYYMGKAKQGKLFAQVNALYGVFVTQGEAKTSMGSWSETTTKPNTDWNAGVTLGYEYFLNSHIGLYGSLGLVYGKSKSTTTYSPSKGDGYSYISEASTLHIPLQIGFQVHISKSQHK